MLTGLRIQQNVLKCLYFPKDRFIDAVEKVVSANKEFVPPYGSGATLYIRPYMFGISPVIGVKPAEDYQFRVFSTPVGPIFQGRRKAYYN